MRFESGQQIGAYRIIRLLGQGGMGAVYEVEHTQLGVHYALKAFTLEDGHVDVLKNKFLTEGKVLARLHDQHLVRVFDLNFDETTGTPYFVMELVLYDDGSPRALSDVSTEELVEVIRSGKYDADKARFRTFLSLLIRRQLITLYRQDQARHLADRCSIDDLTEELSVPSEQQDQVDLSWAKAKHEAAVEHVLTKVAMKQQSRQIYRAYVLENRPIDEVSAAFGVTPDIIYKVKNRVNKMIEAVEMEYAE